jgi:protein-serine/threonine kinase
MYTLLQLHTGRLADSFPPPGSLPEESHFDALPKSKPPTDYAALVKNKSTSNLLAQRVPPPINTAKRLSVDAGQLDRMAR